MPIPLLKKCEKAFPRATFTQTYACSEACSSITFTNISGGMHLEPNSPGLSAVEGRTASGEKVLGHPVGRPANHLQISIADEAGVEVPPGVVGRVRTKGAHVMMGYLNLPQETSLAISGGWLYPGDLGFLSGEGVLHFVSRQTDRINTGGEKVFANEIESLLCKHEAVSQVAVFGVPHERLGEAVMAVIVRSQASTASEGALISTLDEYCRSHLSPYKVPRKIHVWHEQELPINSSGKLQKAEIRRYFVARQQSKL
mmetsp:Transcript_49267/g.76941  ORF Transcript_49267/g.76941 Transcript_49267/m.76941 type:complete len:256 (-) Transcript_49267:23-790(-)